MKNHLKSNNQKLFKKSFETNFFKLYFNKLYKNYYYFC